MTQLSSLVGAVCRITATIDGKTVRVEDVGDCEEPHNWPHDGARAKDAISDSLKRCAARLGVGLHLWSQDGFFLYDVLCAADKPQQKVAEARKALDGTEPFEEAK